MGGTAWSSISRTPLPQLAGLPLLQQYPLGEIEPFLELGDPCAQLGDLAVLRDAREAVAADPAGQCLANGTSEELVKAHATVAITIRIIT